MADFEEYERAIDDLHRIMDDWVQTSKAVLDQHSSLCLRDDQCQCEAGLSQVTAIRSTELAQHDSQFGHLAQ